MQTFQLKVSPLRVSQHHFLTNNKHHIVSHPIRVESRIQRPTCSKSIIEMSMDELDKLMKKK